MATHLGFPIETNLAIFYLQVTLTFHKNQHQWIRPDILDEIKSRERHKSLGNHNEYKYWKNKVTKLIKQANKAQYETYLENNKIKPGSIYKPLQEVGSGKG